MAKYVLGHQAQIRSRAIRYTLLVGILLLTVAVLQVSFFGRFRFLGASPDLMICTTLCIAYFSGRYMGAVTGIAAGFLIEALGTEGVMLLAVCYLFLGYLAGHYAKITPSGYTTYLLYLGVTLVYRAAITVLYACLNYQTVRLPDILLYSVLPEMLLTAIAGCVMYFPLYLYCKWLDKK